MSMRLPYQTERDETLPHQVVIYTPSNSNEIHVSCNCLSWHEEKVGPGSYKSMGKTENIQHSRDIYNNPENHSKPFGPEDVAKW